LWARVYRPVDLSQAPYPVLVFLHGNHATCGRFEGAGPGRFDINVQYTFTGTCPAGYVVVPVTPDTPISPIAGVMGLHRRIINANRGVNAAPGVADDRGLNLRRGRWCSSTCSASANGTRREGRRRVSDSTSAARWTSRTSACSDTRVAGKGCAPRTTSIVIRESLAGPDRTDRLRGDFRIGPVDGQTSRILDADGNVMERAAADVRRRRLQPAGRQAVRSNDADQNETPATPKSTFTVWGANHNFYNTEWQLSDSPGCLGHKRLFDHLLGSPDQRITALASVLAFFRGHVGAAADPALATIFNPQFDFPATVTDLTRIDRGYTDSPNAAVTRTFDDFDRPSGFNSSGAANTASNVTVVPWRHRQPQRSAARGAGGVAVARRGDLLPEQLDAPGVGQSAAAFKTLEFRVARQCGDDACTKTDAQWLFATSSRFGWSPRTARCHRVSDQQLPHAHGPGRRPGDVHRHLSASDPADDPHTAGGVRQGGVPQAASWRALHLRRHEGGRDLHRQHPPVDRLERDHHAVIRTRRTGRR
jgi:hypothetical protein